MDFDFPPEAEAFRIEFRAWLDEHVDDRFRDLGIDLEGGADWIEPMREWNALLADAGYAAIAWPAEYGGRGAGLMEQVVFAEEMHRAHAPGPLNPIGISNIAPAIIQFGTPAQKSRFLPRMRRGDDIWCQGFSEPDAGSDLASLKTRAVREVDHFVVNGHKVWNTLGHVANWCELLVRTDPEAAKHKGISCLLVDLSLPGVEVRPLMTITGDREFSELRFVDVRVPADALLGPVNGGWTVAITTLAHERSGVGDLHLATRAKILDLIDAARHSTLADGTRAASDGAVRQRLAALYVQGEYLKLLADRAISGALNGRPPGPESSIAKLLWSDLEQQIAEVAAAVLGPEANTGRWGRDRVYARALSIAGGTTQMNKNIIAQRLLGLPR